MRYKALSPSLRGATRPDRPRHEAGPARRTAADWLATLAMLAVAAVVLVPPGALASGAALSASPATVSGGDQIRITGTGFPAGEGAPTPEPTGPGRVTCAGYPEPRIFTEAQSWWLRTPGDGGTEFGHMHVGACLPYKQTVSGVIGIDVRIILHDNPGQFDYLNPVLVSNSQELSLAHDLTLHDLTCPVGTCTGWVHLDVDTRLISSDGLQEIRLRAYVDEPDGNIMHSSINTLANFRNGNPVSDLERRAYQRGKGWYTGSGYCESDVVSDLPVGPVSGVWSPALRIVDHGAADDLPVTHHSVRIDPDFHAVPPVPGTILVEGSGPWAGSVAIDTTKLADGRHRLVLRADCDDPRGSTNSGVLVVVFTVANIGPPPPPPTSTTFVPIDPVRLLDSRFNVGLSGQFTANRARSVTIAGRLGIPNDAKAITANLTVVGQQQAGYLSVTPDPDNNPSTSALNFPRGDVRANNITSTLADDGKLSIVYRAGAGKKTHVLLDVTGYFLENNTGATFAAITPARLLDTRFANGLTGKFTSHVVRHFDVAGRGGVPANATAVTGNLTVVGQNDDGYVTLGPDLADNPATSTINFPLADTRANGITVRLNSTDHPGHLDAIYIAAPGKTTHLLFDVTGYYVQNLTGSKFYPLDPGRVLDSRFGTGLSGTFKTDIARALQIEGRVGVPAAAVGISGNLTVVGQTDDGYVSMTKALDNTPDTSTLNFPIGDVRANGVTGPLTNAGTAGLVYKASPGKTTHLILDITGYFAP